MTTLEQTGFLLGLPEFEIIEFEVPKCRCVRKTHNLSKHPLYGVWQDMKQRCYLWRSQKYQYYGGRGIRMCVAWLDDFMTFYSWALANEYEKGLQIDRMDNSGHYEPGNCRWTTRTQQARNCRSNRDITIDGETKTLTEWSEIAGIDKSTIHTRFYLGWRGKQLLLPLRQGVKAERRSSGIEHK